MLNRLNMELLSKIDSICLVISKVMPYYAVARGRETGIFPSWDECNTQINGFSAAKYKKFDTKQEAKEFLKGIVLSNSIEEKSYELEQIIDCLIEPLMHCQKRNKTNTFLLIGKEELKLKLRSLRVFIETPFLEENSIAGKALHFELTLKYCLANFCKT